MAINSITPDFVLICIVIVTVKDEISSGLKVGALAGLIQDLISNGTFGMGLFVKTFSGFIAAFSKKQIFSDNIVSKMFIVLIVTLVDGIISLFLLNIFYARISVMKEFLTLTLPMAVYNGILLGVILLIRDAFISVKKYFR